MLLLDNNVQIALIQYFKSIKIDCGHASELGWHELENGKLVSKAAENGFTAIITNDKRFSETGRAALKKIPNFSIVVLRIPQATVNIYLQEFKTAWENSPPVISPGEVVFWPKAIKIE